MSDWRDIILRELAPNVSPLTVVCDPDALVREQVIVDTLRERGFAILEIEDAVQFRFAYESEFRIRWDVGEASQLIIFAKGATSVGEQLPYDVLTDARTLQFSLSQFFPQLHHAVVKSLETSDYDILYRAVRSFHPGHLGENASKEFILRHVFEIAPELIKTEVDLLRMLLRRHYTRRDLPAILDERLIAVLRSNPSFEEWPLERLLRDRAAFLRFLQERWVAHLDSLSGGVVSRPSFHLPGPTLLPFEHDDIRVYVDNYFTDGLLQPVAHPIAEEMGDVWQRIGVAVDVTGNAERRAARLASRIADAIPDIDARPVTWFRFAYQWAELNSLALTNPTIRDTVKLDVLRGYVESGFRAWLCRHYAGLASLPPVPPVMVHHLPRNAARHLDDAPNARVAVVVVDGLSVAQWMALRDVILEQDKGIAFDEDASFAWLPTLTAVSRQAIFAGRPPLYFPDSIHTTDKEAALWQRFWSQQGLHPRQVGYLKGLGQGSLDSVEELVTCGELRVVGLVVDTVDRIMHGMELEAMKAGSPSRRSFAGS
ncbi:MAG: BREX-3 system phosphatase PglZ [bacterium]